MIVLSWMLTVLLPIPTIPPLLSNEPFPETTLLFIVTLVLPATPARPFPLPELFPVMELPEALSVVFPD